MLLTTTARKKIAKALRAELRINTVQAHAILDRVDNWHAFDHAEFPLANLEVVPARANTSYPRATIYTLTDEGYAYVAVITLRPADIARWNALSLEEAYLSANQVASFSAPMRDTQGRILELKYGTILGCQLRDDHIEVDVIVDGVKTIFVKIPGINTLKGTYQYVLSMLGMSGQMLVGTIGDNELGIDPETTFLDMFLAGRDTTRLAA